MSPLPEWIPSDAWAGFAEMRKKLKKPLTDAAAKLVTVEMPVTVVTDRRDNSALEGQ